MDNILLQILNYFLLIAKITLSQILLLFGPLIFLAVLMNIVSTKLENLGLSIFGEKIYLYGFAWLGVATHEIGHAVFAIIFGHRIHRIVLFNPNADGTLGSVEHRNIYQTIGNFFIGIGPIIFGSIIISLVVYLFIGYNVGTNFKINNIQELWNDISLIELNLNRLYKGVILLINAIISELKTAPLRSIIFLFIAFSIGSSITLSKPDIASAQKGFLFFLLIVLLFNLITIWFSDISYGIIHFASRYIMKLSSIIVFCLMLNVLFLVLFRFIYFLKFSIFR